MEESSSYLLKIERILVPMAKGESSRRAFDIAMVFGKILQSNITALTLKEEVKEVTWSDKVAIVTNAYKIGKNQGIKIIPKVQSAKSIKQGIVDEINSKGYDLAIFSARIRDSMSSSLLGGIGDYIIKKSKNTVVGIGIKNGKYPYDKILVPLSERLNTRKSLYISGLFAKILGAKLIIMDERELDKKVVHGFKTLIKNEFWKDLNVECEIIKGAGENIVDDVVKKAYVTGANIIFLGVRPDQYSNVRINSDIKKILRETHTDVAIVKR